MKLIKLLSIVLLVSFIAIGCGSGGGSSNSEQHAPSISDARAEPQSLAVGEGGGAVMVNGSISFHDMDGDIATLTIISSLGTETREVYNVDGDMYGTISGGYVVDTTKAAIITFTVYVTDSTGQQSNRLTTTVTVS